MKKRLLSVLLTIVMVMTMIPMTVLVSNATTDAFDGEWATIPTNVASVTVDGTTTNYTALADAIAAAVQAENSELKLLDHISADTYVTVDSGKFTLNLNGKTWTSSSHVLWIGGTADVKITDTAGGALKGTSDENPTIHLDGSAKLEIAGGMVEHTNGSNAITMWNGGLTTSSELTVSGGTVKANSTDLSIAISAYGNAVTVTGGTIEGAYCDIEYANGIIDLSGHSDPTGITIANFTGSSVTVGSESFKIPDGCAMLDSNGDAQTTLRSGETYTVGAEPATPEPVTPEPATPEPATVTGVNLSGNGVTFDAETNTYYISVDATDIVLTLTGTNFTNLTMDYYIWYAVRVDCTIYPGYMAVDTENNTATRSDLIAGEFVGSDGFEICYSADDGQTWTGLGVYVTCEDSNAPVVNEVRFNTDSPAYNAETNTFTIDQSNPLIITLTGENLEKLAENYGTDYPALVAYDANSWFIFGNKDMIQGVTDSEMKFVIDFDTFSASKEAWASICAFGYSNDGTSLDDHFALTVTVVENEELAGKIVINMTDTYGDGWNNAAIRIYKDGELVAEATIASGSSGTLELDYDSEAEYAFFWFPGQYDNECGYTIYVDGVAYTEELLTDPNIPRLTGISFNSDSPAYNAETNTFTIDPSNPLVITLTGENLDSLNEIYGLNNRFSLAVRVNSSWFVAPLDLFQSATSTEATFLIDLDIFSSLQENAGWEDITGFGFSNDGNNVEAAFDLNVIAYFVVEIEESNDGTVSYSPADADEGDEVTLVITPNDGYEFDTLTVTDKDGNPVAYDENYTFTIPEGGVTVIATFVFDPHFHEKDGYEIVWSETFDDGKVPEDFTSVDVDGDGYGWVSGEKSGEYGTDFTCHECKEGSCIVSPSYINSIGSILNTHNLLMFPTFELAEGSEYLLSFMVKAQDKNFCDSYNVHVSLDGGETYVWSRGVEPSPQVWTEITLDLSEYAGESVTVVIDHQDVDMFYVNIDCVYLYRKGSANKIVGASVTLGADLTMTYTATVDETLIGEGETLAMLYEMNGETTVVPAIGENGRYTFPFEGILPQNMGDTVKATLVILDADGNVVETIDTKEEYSIKAYVQRLLDNHGDNEKLVNLLTELVTYGAAAQIYANHRVDALVSDGISGLGTPSEALPTLADDVFAITPEAAGETRFTSATVRLGNMTHLVIRLHVDTDVTMMVRNNGYLVSILNFSAEEGTQTYVTQGLYAVDFNNVFSFELYDAEGQLIQTMSYSVNTYAQHMMNVEDGVMTDAVKDLTLALYRYGVAAEAYVDD